LLSFLLLAKPVTRRERQPCRRGRKFRRL